MTTYSKYHWIHFAFTINKLDWIETEFSKKEISPILSIFSYQETYQQFILCIEKKLLSFNLFKFLKWNLRFLHFNVTFVSTRLMFENRKNLYLKFVTFKIKSAKYLWVEGDISMTRNSKVYRWDAQFAWSHIKIKYFSFFSSFIKKYIVAFQTRTRKNFLWNVEMLLLILILAWVNAKGYITIFRILFYPSLHEQVTSFNWIWDKHDTQRTLTLMWCHEENLVYISFCGSMSFRV